MAWAVIACAAASSYAAAKQSAASEAREKGPEKPKPKQDIEKLVAEHKRKMDRLNASSMRRNALGLWLLLGVILSAGALVYSVAIGGF